MVLSTWQLLSVQPKALSQFEVDLLIDFQLSDTAFNAMRRPCLLALSR